MKRRPSINIITGEHPEWREGIKKCHAFFCYLSQQSIHKPLAWEQLIYAEQLGKPIRAFVEKGTEIPEGFFMPFTDLQMFVVTSPDEVGAIMVRLMREAIEEDLHG